MRGRQCLTHFDPIPGNCRFNRPLIFLIQGLFQAQGYDIKWIGIVLEIVVVIDVAKLAVAVAALLVVTAVVKSAAIRLLIYCGCCCCR